MTRRKLEVVDDRGVVDASAEGHAWDRREALTAVRERRHELALREAREAAWGRRGLLRHPLEEIRHERALRLAVLQRVRELLADALRRRRRGAVLCAGEEVQPDVVGDRDLGAALGVRDDERAARRPELEARVPMHDLGARLLRRAFREHAIGLA